MGCLNISFQFRVLSYFPFIFQARFGAFLITWQIARFRCFLKIAKNKYYQTLSEVNIYFCKCSLPLFLFKRKGKFIHICLSICSLSTCQADSFTAWCVGASAKQLNLLFLYLVGDICSCIILPYLRGWKQIVRHFAVRVRIRSYPGLK